MYQEPIKLGDASSKHQYELEVSFGQGSGKFKIVVDANTRTQARKIAEQEMYIVHSVNMVG